MKAKKFFTELFVLKQFGKEHYILLLMKLQGYFTPDSNVF